MNYFKLYANCIPVKGFSESIILDLQNFQSLAIPNLLFKVLNKNKNLTISELKALFKNQLNNGIDAYFDFLVANGLGFFTDEPLNFPELPLEWHSPHKIISAIIEVNFRNNTAFYKTLKDLNDLSCAVLDLRFVGNFKKEDFSQLIEFLADKRFKSVSIFIESAFYEKSFSKFLLHKHSCIDLIVVHSNDIEGNSDPRYDKNVYEGTLLFTKKIINSNSDDSIKPSNFILNTSFFAEAQKHHTGLFRKVCVDVNGNIKNYLSHPQIFGNIETDSIFKIINQPNFKEKWFISNNKIQKCKACQFRYSCLDNTDIYKDEQNKWHKKRLCGFDPYSNKWFEY